MNTQNEVVRTAPIAETTGPERVKRAVVDAARTLFAERGIHAVSVREIAREVGVSHTLLHLYFGSKEEILRQVIATNGGMDAHLDEAKTSREAGENVFGTFIENSEQVRVLAAAIMEGFVPAKIPFDPPVGKELAARLAEPGALRSDLDPALVSAMITSSAIGWAVAGDWLCETFGIDAATHEAAVKNLLGEAIDGVI
ncbi:MAG TPA: helix-turn-helix domain-containing protein [Coriobacteriia bacterium]|nr:helix-turn-helix domain-containing protein [Coriobacteriia bacterium]